MSNLVSALDLIMVNVKLIINVVCRSLMDDSVGTRSMFNASDDRERLLASASAYQPVSTTGWALDDDEPSASQPLLREATPADLQLDHNRLLKGD